MHRLKVQSLDRAKLDMDRGLYNWKEHIVINLIPVTVSQ
jgi:hypothetical protein